MPRYLSFEVVVRIIDAERIGPIRDVGLLQSALERPATTVFGNDAYVDLDHKAAALMHSLCTNHALVDGNKRLAAILALVFVDINGADVTLDEDGLFDLTMAIADGTLDEVDQIAEHLRIVPRG